MRGSIDINNRGMDVLTLLIRVHLCKKSSLQFNFTQLVLTYLYLKYELSYYIFN
jgi:hypothetical protein